jgi:hypothetical protein
MISMQNSNRRSHAHKAAKEELCEEAFAGIGGGKAEVLGRVGSAACQGHRANLRGSIA